MSGRELLVLGTASQVPTASRAHHGALLRFDGHGVLFDPGEGTQRQMTLAGVPASAIDRICITHAHGDHCLGLPGVIQRLSLDRVTHPVDVYYPAAADVFVRRLRHACAFEDAADIRLHPVGPGPIAGDAVLALRAERLSHVLPTLGWRLEEPAGVRFDPDALDAAGVHGPLRSELAEHGHVVVGGRRVDVEEVSRPRPGTAIGFIMDTRDCPGARAIAERVDLLVIEATFLESERELAEVAGHLTAAQAARIAAEAGARRVVLTHFSRRYPDTSGHLAEARAAAPGLDLHVAADLDLIPLP